MALRATWAVARAARANMSSVLVLFNDSNEGGYARSEGCLSALINDDGVVRIRPRAFLHFTVFHITSPHPHTHTHTFPPTKSFPPHAHSSLLSKRATCRNIPPVLLSCCCSAACPVFLAETRTRLEDVAQNSTRSCFLLHLLFLSPPSSSLVVLDDVLVKWTWGNARM